MVLAAIVIGDPRSEIPRFEIKKWNGRVSWYCVIWNSVGKKFGRGEKKREILILVHFIGFAHRVSINPNTQRKGKRLERKNWWILLHGSVTGDRAKPAYPTMVEDQKLKCVSSQKRNTSRFVDLWWLESWRGSRKERWLGSRTRNTVIWH